MTESTNAADASPRPLHTRSFVRRIVYPVAVILAIAAVIWWLENRDDDATDSSGQEYGLRESPPALTRTAPTSTDGGRARPRLRAGDASTAARRWLSDFRGQPVVLNFWATWCQPCRKEIPQFVDAYDKYRDDGLVVIGLEPAGRAAIDPAVRPGVRHRLSRS